MAEITRGSVLGTFLITTDAAAAAASVAFF